MPFCSPLTYGVVALLIFVGKSHASYARHVAFTDCGSPDYGGNVQAVMIAGCAPDPRIKFNCKLVSGADIMVALTFNLKPYTVRQSARIQAGVVVEGFAVVPLITDNKPGFSSNITVTAASDFPWMAMDDQTLAVAFTFANPTSIPDIPAEPMTTFKVRVTGEDLADQLLCAEFQVEL